jgi:cytochrome c peroxidase
LILRRVAALLAVVAGLGVALAAPAGSGRPPPRAPADNPTTPAKVELGRRLFYDADLSIDGTMACATCHEQRRGFADGNRTRPGVHGDPGRRNVPGLANVGWITPLTWADGSLTTLEAQALVPILGTEPVEMGMAGSEGRIAERLGADRCYRRMFARAFPERKGAIDLATVVQALAAFERTLASFDSPFDRYVGGGAPLPAAAMRGFALFDARCASCHAGPAFTDGRFHAIGTESPQDRGLVEKSGIADDSGKFRTAGLRNVALAPPYLHDGSAPSLADAIRRHRSPGEIAGLSAEQIDDLVAFLGALTDRHFVSDPRTALPGKACGRRL